VKVKHQNNLIRLIFIHLLLFAYPLASKTFHVHHSGKVYHEFSAHAGFEQTEDSCPVCDFEFYNFVSAKIVNTVVVQHCISAYKTPPFFAVFVPFFQYFSLRAPPVA